MSRVPGAERKSISKAALRGRPTTPADLRVATWNLLFRSNPEKTLPYLDAALWDIACLQEVNRRASDLLAGSVHAATQLITALPERAVEIRLLDRQS